MILSAAIAVSQRIDRYPDRDEIRDAVDQALIRWIGELGFAAIPVPNAMGGEGVELWLDRVEPAGVVLSGGNDIGAEDDRDRTESRLIRWAEERGRPLLGICRGMQMLAVEAGGSLKRIEGHVRTRHALGPPYGEVNSFHDMAIERLPDAFTVLARSADGEVEAMRHRSGPVLGWMWHPERERPFDPAHLAMARGFFRAPAG